MTDWRDEFARVLPPEVEVPSPFGVYHPDGTHTPSIDRPTEKTRFPELVDPKTGWPIETRILERIGLTYEAESGMVDWWLLHEREMQLALAMFIDAMRQEFFIQEKNAEE